MRRPSFTRALCLLYLLAGVAYRGASAAAGVGESLQDPHELLEQGRQQLGKQEYPEAVASLLRSIQSFETRSGLLSLELIEPLEILVRSYAASRQYEPMASAAQRALAIVRRTAGIYDARQLPFIEHLIDAQSRLGRATAALPSLRYRERVSTAAYGEDSVEHARELIRIGDWYCRLGDFFASRQRHRNAIAIIEAATNNHSPALIEPLRAVARCCLMELALEGVESSSGVAQSFRGAVLRTGRLDPQSVTFTRHVQDVLRFDGEQAIVRAAQITSVPDNALPELQLEVLLQAADWFQLRDQPRAAAEYYKRAYEVSLAVPGYDQQQWLEPKQLLYAVPPIALRNVLRGGVSGERYVEMGFTVRADGKVRSPEVVTKEDAGKTIIDETTASLLSARYRPRLVEGRPTSADGVRLRQQF
jgi:tetratricopeptide (TPR) repeat protein